jgi:selenocysteine lyase/cysteine desulfurase
VEDALQEILSMYANTHTEDDATGRLTTERLHEAEKTIKRLVNADEDYAVVAVGAGTTGAIQRLQEILGLYVPPASQARRNETLSQAVGEEELRRLADAERRLRPVVFVGPYEHHSNELSWREGPAEVVEIELDADGLLDPEDLGRKVADPAYDGRLKIGSFSACSNVTGLLTPVYEVARILHKAGCLAFFDFAASAPYRNINVRHDEQAFFDAVFFSPHKFLGGPGSSGILVFRRQLYRSDLPPSFAGGGTVDFVSWDGQDYVRDLETREKAGTPPILQTIRAAYAMELKDRLGEDLIEERESDLIRRAMERFAAVPEIEIVGNPHPDRRIPIFSFVVKTQWGYLHPRYVTQLLNDLFGVQSRAGCLCAGPYGHRLLGIDERRSGLFRRAIREGRCGLKPGWTRLNFHYLMTEVEFAFLCDAVEFVAQNGRCLLSLYVFDAATGAWRHRDWAPEAAGFGLGRFLEGAPPEAPIREEPSADLFASYLEEAAVSCERMRKQHGQEPLSTTDPELVPFVYARAEESPGRPMVPVERV